MRIFVYLIASHDHKHVHAGYTENLFKMLAFYNKIPNLLNPQQRLNRMIYVEEYNNIELAVLRFEEMTRSPHADKLALAKTVNPDLIELIPGLNFELT